MTIEELSKSQLVLLTILVNFVVSIATGILTVSLLDQAPPVVTQTVNRVVDHTIEKVVEVAPVVVKPAPPAPSGQELVMASLAASAARAVAIYPLKTGTSTAPFSRGTYLPEARAVVTAQRTSLPKEVLVAFSDGTTVPASLSRSSTDIVIYGFSDGAVLPRAGAPALIDSGTLRLGQTVVAVASDGSAATGIISRVNAAGVHTTLQGLGAGGAAVDLDGNVVGIVALDAGPGLLLGAEVITQLLQQSAVPTR